jgi:hypothetical protein
MITEPVAFAQYFGEGEVQEMLAFFQFLKGHVPKCE